MGPVILSSSELARMREQLRDSTSTPNKREDERLHLKALSDARAGRWPNTLEAGRKNKEAERAASFEREEQSRRANDRVEATDRAEERQRHIQRASKKLYDETERVKSFHSSLLLSDVLSEREAQIESAEHMQSLKERHEATFVREQAQSLIVAETAETIKEKERAQRIAETNQFVLGQIDELRRNAHDEYLLDKQEGRMIRQRALEEAQEKEAEKEKRRAVAVADRAATALANEALKLHRFREAQEAEKFDRAQEAFARRKELTNLARQARDSSKRAEAQKKRDAIVAVMEQQLAAKEEEDDSRFEKEARAAELVAEEKEAMKAADRIEDLQMIHRSRQQQLAIREYERQRVLQEEQDEVRRWQLRSLELEEEEKERAAANRMDAKKVQAMHINQIRRKQAKAEFELQRELEDFERGERAIEEDDQLFKHYAATCVEEWARQGKSTRPMMVELAKPRDKVTRVGYSVD